MVELTCSSLTSDDGVRQNANFNIGDIQSSGEKNVIDNSKFGSRIEDIRAKLNTIKTDMDTDSEFEQGKHELYTERHNESD